MAVSSGEVHLISQTTPNLETPVITSSLKDGFKLGLKMITWIFNTLRVSMLSDGLLKLLSVDVDQIIKRFRFSIILTYTTRNEGKMKCMIACFRKPWEELNQRFLWNH